ncbi:MAG: hypothetical protein JSU67_07625 [Gammaproteobacteria bacterium]|nr:MAG: hypothetical protein JSU67_07625 [Gammaproteobacteria bacterium]
MQLTAKPIGEGQERICYRHPDNPALLIKLQKGVGDRQTRRELALYRSLERRGMDNYQHIPRFYGMVETNLGRGYMVDLVADYDGSPSKSLWWHFERGYPVSEFLPYLEELKQYLLDNLVVFSVDMGRYNILFQKLSPQQARLVVIDGLGNHTAINWLDSIAYFARLKINRRWQRFIGRLQNYSAQMMRSYGATPKTLDAAYRR